jgi:glycosyltransferase involved in cell wall biosynthesis
MAKAPLPISVCMIANNEAHRIRRALDNITGWTAEIILILNEDVSDGTDKIAVEYGAKVYSEPWKGFIAQKNSAAEKASCEWILGLDADEAISSALKNEILELFAQPQRLQGFAAFDFPRCTLYGDRWIRHGDWYPDRQTRLWRRDRAQWGGEDPHAKILASGNIGKLKADMLHYSMEDLNHLIRKTISYTDTFARQKMETGLRVGLATLWFRPMWRFIRCYFLRLGFLDGWQGFSIAWLGAFYTFLRYAKVRELNSQK